MSEQFNFRSSRFDALSSLRIAVLMGGFSDEREVSLRSGENVLRRLLGMGLQAFPLEVNSDLVSRMSQLSASAAYNILHGTFGEDGHVQGLLEFFKIPYTGEDLGSSAVCFHKVRTKEILRANYFPTSDYFSFESLPNDLNNALRLMELRSIAAPLMLKPFLGGSSLGIKKIADQQQLKKVLAELFETGKAQNYFVEKYISGREITVGLFRDGAQVRLLPILELRPKKEFYDYEAKYTAGMTEMILPARLSKALQVKVERLALSIFECFHFANCVRIDMILEGDCPFVLEINTQPGMTATSDIPAMLGAAEIPVEYFLACNLENALNRKKTLEN
jgi:D-alanine-D-alanine ligase